MKYMLDTNMCIYAQKHMGNVVSNIQKHIESGICISSITLAELEYGIWKSVNKEKNRISLMQFISVIDILPFDKNAAEEYGKICAELSSKGNKIGYMDMLISAHAKSTDLIVVTHNMREFSRVDGLTAEDWF